MQKSALSERQRCFPLHRYDLASTLTSGQAFRWQLRGDSWEGVVGSRWVRLKPHRDALQAEVAEPVADWSWLTHYLQLGVDLDAITATFPKDEPMRASVARCSGLRLLRQDPWECLASFILSSTKQIVQIQQIIRLLCQRYGAPLAVPPGRPPAHAFPTSARLAQLSEEELRACKMGFRAPNLLATAGKIARHEPDLAALETLTLGEARDELMQLPGVGRKIADCVLLFAYGFPEAFPVDVWVSKALRQLYFPKRRPRPGRLRRFIATYFGPHAGYAQQYLFHYMRTRGPSPARGLSSPQQLPNPPEHGSWTRALE